MNKKHIDGRLGRTGALKRHMPLAVMLIAVFAAVMANYAFSADTIYDEVSAGNYVDVGLDTSKGISMNLIEKGLTHKVLEFEITSDIDAQDIQLLIAENNFDAKEGSLSKFSIATREEPIYETSCAPYTITDETNGSVMEISNCTTAQTGTNTVEYDEWLPVELKSSEKNSDNSLASFNILEKGKYRYSFDTPIVRNENGWGNAGTVFLKVGDGLFADKQHSSWWNSSWSSRIAINITNNDNTNDLLKYHTVYLSNLNTAANISAGNMRADCFDLRVVCNEEEQPRVFINDTFLSTTGGCGDTNTTILTWLNQNISASTSNATDCYLYMKNSGATNHSNLKNVSTFSLYFNDGSITTGGATEQRSTNILVNDLVSFELMFNMSGAPANYMPIGLNSANNSCIEMIQATSGGYRYVKILGTGCDASYYSGSGTTIKQKNEVGIASGITYHWLKKDDGDFVLDAKNPTWTHYTFFDVNNTATSPQSVSSISFIPNDAANNPTFTDILLQRTINNAPSFSLLKEPEEPVSEEQARATITTAITSKIPSAAIYTDPQVYARYLNGTQLLGSFDKVAAYGNQRWAFNYITSGENFTNLINITPSLYVWEQTNLTNATIQSQIEALIDSTKA